MCNHISAWKTDVLPNESIKPHVASNNSLAPTLNTFNTKLRVKFNGSYLKQEKVAFLHKNVVNIYTAYEINLWQFTVGKYFVNIYFYLFRAVGLATNTDPDKYKYSGYDIVFDPRVSFSLFNGCGFGKNLMIFGEDMSSYVHVDDRKKIY